MEKGLQRFLTAQEGKRGDNTLYELKKRVYQFWHTLFGYYDEKSVIYFTLSLRLEVAYVRKNE